MTLKLFMAMGHLTLMTFLLAFDNTGWVYNLVAGVFWLGWLGIDYTIDKVFTEIDKREKKNAYRVYSTG